jgi:site-specific recombinase XerD
MTKNVSKALVAISSRSVAASKLLMAVPAIVVRAHEKAAKRFIEFFFATIRNQNTRDAYYRACCRFLSWCEHHRITDLASIEPIHVAAYIELLGRDFEKSTVKQHLAAIRMLFDWLLTGQVVAMNPATSVRGPKYSVMRGKTPVLTPAEARRILNCIDTSTLVGLRDRALIALMVFSFARVSAAISMQVEDYYLVGERWWIRLQEKGGKLHEMPAHHELEIFMNSYIQAANFTDEKGTALFRACGRKDKLLDRPLTRIDAYRMIRRRGRNVGLDSGICCHSFRATGITAYLNNGGTLEKAQTMAAHNSPRTTKLYDRTDDTITLEEVERIAI